MKKIIAFLFLLLTSCTASINKVDYKEAKQLTEKGAVLIDVRSPLEYDQGHAKGAINVPLQEIDLITYKKDKKIIVYCRSGSRSKTAAETLIQLGYKYIYDLGSKDNWEGKIVKSPSQVSFLSETIIEKKTP